MKNYHRILGIILLMTTCITACKKESDDRDQFVATYSAEDKYTLGGQSLTDTYSFSITKSSSDPNRILLNGFGNAAGVTVEATVSGRSITIPQQTIVSDGESIGISGSGNIDGSRLTYSYSLSLLGATLNINGTANKL